MVRAQYRPSGKAGTYYAIAGKPGELTTAALLGLVVLFYVAGNVVQGAAVIWEGPYWQRRGGWPSARRMTAGNDDAYQPGFQALVQAKLDVLVGSDTASLPVGDKFALARAELRRQGQDTRSESFNSIYGLSRGLVSAGVVAVIVSLVCVIVGHAIHRDSIAAAIVAVSVVPVFVRFTRFSFYFGDQVWKDFAALPAT